MDPTNPNLWEQLAAQAPFVAISLLWLHWRIKRLEDGLKMISESLMKMKRGDKDGEKDNDGNRNGSDTVQLRR